MTSLTEWREREVVLANGARVPLFAAAAAVALFEGLLAGDQQERGLAFVLRNCCLSGHPVPEPFAGPLIEMGAVGEDRGVDPTLRQVVLSAVRGERHALAVANPFTDPRDRAVAELLVARAKLEQLLSPDECSELFAATLAGPGSWARRFPKANGGTDLPPPSPN